MKEIRTSGPLMFSDPNCPTRVGEIVNTISEIYDIPNPSEGMQVYVRDEKKTYTITGLKEAVIGGERVPNAKVDTFEAVKSQVEEIDKNFAKMRDALSDGSFLVGVANLANAVKDGAVTFEMLDGKLRLSASVVDNLETANTLMPLSANQGKILKELIDIINGTGEGSTDKKITDAIAALVNRAPENLDTLRELADWIEAHGAKAEEILADIKANADNLAEAKKDIANRLIVTPTANSVGVTGRNEQSMRINFEGNIPAATTEKAGVMSAEDKKMLTETAEHFTVRFDIIEENEATINAGEIDSTPAAIVYYKPANKFVAADSSGNYWSYWDGIEDYMNGDEIRKSKIYLCGDKAYTMQNVSNPHTTTIYKLREIDFVNDSKSQARHFNYIGNYPFSQKAIDAGADKMIIAGYLDIEYEDGKAYMFSVAVKNSDKNRIVLYKKDKDLPRNEADVTHLLAFAVSKIEGSPYYLAKGIDGYMPKSWFIIDWDNVKKYDSLYDYDGIALSPSLFKGCGLSSRIEQIYSEFLESSIQPIQGGRILNNSIDAVKLRNRIFITENKYSPSVAEVYILPKYQVNGIFKYKVYNGSAYLRPYSGSTLIYNTRVKLPDESYNEEVLPLTVYQSNDANIAVNDIAGYIVFRRGYIEDNDNAEQGEELNRGYITVEGYAPRISQFIKDNTPNTEEDVDYSYLISIPATFDVVAGDTLQIFKRSVIKAYNPYLYDVEFTGSIGKDYPRYFSYKSATSDAGKIHSIKVVVRNDKGDILCEKDIQINVIVAITSSTKKILMMGASSMASGYISKEIQRRITGTDGESGNPANPKGLGLGVQFVGRTIAQGVNQEATGGWSWDTYSGQGTAAYRFNVSGVSQLNMGDSYTLGGLIFTIEEINVTDGTGNIRCTYTGSGTPAASGVLTRLRGTGDESITYESCVNESFNPFWNNGNLDFKNYASQYCGGRIDVIMAHCGVNDAWESSRTAELVVADIRKFAAAYKADFPDGKFVLSTLPLPDCTGGMAANYGCSHHYYTKALKFWEYAEAFNALSDEVDYIYASQVLPTFDCEYGYPKTATPVNNRATTTEQLGTNGVHPTAEGSKMVADAIYATLNKVL